MFTKYAQSCLMAFMAVLFASTAHAALIGSMYHAYGMGLVDPGGNDPLWINYVIVQDSSTSPFNDSFDLSGMNLNSIDRFELTLTFTNTYRSADQPGFPPGLFDVEDWTLRPGGSLTAYLDMTDVEYTLITQTFIIDDSIDTFASMVDSKSFSFWFSEAARNYGGDSFNLYNARLDVYESAATPIPGAVWLLGSGLVGLFGLRRKQS